MPVISLAMLVGLMAMAALPPLNGFAGEWVIYQSFFALGQSEAFIGRLLGPLLAVGTAITGALAVMCMAKVYGVTFRRAAHPRSGKRLLRPGTDDHQRGRAGAVLHRGRGRAVCCRSWAAIPLPLVTAHTVVSQPMMALLLIAAPLLPFVPMLFFRRDRLASRARAAGLRLRTRAVDGHHRPRFRHAGERELCRRAEAAPLAEPGGLGAGLAGAAVPVLFRRPALIELAVLVVIVISRGA